MRAPRLVAMVMISYLTLTGCGTGSRAPLLSPKAVTGSFGYSERQIEPDRFEVSFSGPRRSTYSYPGALRRDRDEDTARREAYDLAAWRVAQIVEARGFVGFRILERNTNVDSVKYANDYWGGPGGYYGPGYGYGWSPRPYSYGFRNWAEDGGYSYQVTQTLVVQLLRDLRPGDFDAKQMIGELRAAYPGADGAAPAS